ncbi:dipeptidase [Rubinisphaera italica]|uniref:Succinyl-diaminopimelate desuccinylase n=1 Tax=Rubinisphaera italica TaxID=2527969 RepID=A0A5C5XPQ0_9PLAN|nr:dipeptidase [Rubinisphaera italica]TWT64045.1 Succinyl-diaminopimelate desuccinylase [Rubinisphaera italica]
MFSQVEEYLNAHRAEHVETLQEFLRIPSVSADSQKQPEMLKAAGLVHQMLERAGMNAKIHETAGHPIVTGEWREAGAEAPTVLIYGHYDVQPPDPLDLWTTPPFDPQIRDGKIYARGATDDKGQAITHILAVEAWMKTVGKLPVNVIFVIEGEEEVGSNNLDLFLEAKKEEYACDVAVVSDTSMYAPDLPAITYGLRGILACEVKVTGPNRDLHSGVFGGAVTNPINALTQMLSKVQDENGRILIPGFYDDVIELSDEERKQFSDLPFELGDFKKDLNIERVHGEEGYSTTERRWARPTFDINGIYGGYQGEGPKTIVPSYAVAKITCRLVPDQNAKQLTAALKSMLESVCPPGIRMEFKDFHGCEGLVFNTSGDHFQAASRAIAHAFGKEPVFIREGGSIPVVASFEEIFGVETLLLGWGLNSDNLHSPNEHFHLANFHRGTLASAKLWEELGR